jgi:ANTAR domain
MVHSADENDDGSAPSARDQDRVTAALDAILERRAVIEQTTGMLMSVYGIDTDAAFERMRAQSQHHNVKLRDVASGISERLITLSGATDVAGRIPFDVVRLVAHDFINPAATEVDSQASVGGPDERVCADRAKSGVAVRR